MKNSVEAGMAFAPSHEPLPQLESRFGPAHPLFSYRSFFSFSSSFSLLFGNQPITGGYRQIVSLLCL